MKLRVEIDNWKYYAHLFGISVIVLGILQIWQGGNMFNLRNIIISSILIGIADIINHQILGLD